ncbi:MAG: sulfatase-like hydrolase/transferase, partial [Planctomycetota bacterium]
MDRRPNILILMTDQHRHDGLGCAGLPAIRTPNLDRLAARGMRFDSATTVSPVCMPARASFINSLYPHNHGMWFNSGQVPPCEPTLFKLLQSAGYRTAHLGKSHYYAHKGVADHMVDREPYMRSLGFDDVHETTGPYATLQMGSYLTDRWQRLGLYETFKADYHERMARGGLVVRPSPLPEDEFPDSYVGRKAVEYIENYDDDKPACLFVGFGGPHDPWDAPEPWASVVDPADTPAAIPPGEATPALPAELADKPDLQSRDELTPEVIAAIRANNYGKIMLVDRWIGRIIDAAHNKG